MCCAGVGKTSIVHRYTSGVFSYSLSSTIGASFLTKKLVVDGCKVRLQIWDTAGQERFRSMVCRPRFTPVCPLDAHALMLCTFLQAPIYYRGAHAAVLVYDITNLDSFDDVKLWLEELRRNMGNDLVIHVVGSKSDLAADMKAVDLAFAKKSVREWLAAEKEDADDDDTDVREETPGGMLSLGLGFGRTGGKKSADLEREKKTRKSKLTEASEEHDRWCKVDVTEVSAKDDYGTHELECGIFVRPSEICNENRHRRPLSPHHQPAGRA
jgi:GTPase SAR1 family protein